MGRHLQQKCWFFYFTPSPTSLEAYSLLSTYNYFFIHKRLSTQNEITKQWPNDNATIQSKVPIKVQNVHNIKSQYPMFMSSFHGPARVTSLEWKLCHTSLIHKDDWQIRGLSIYSYRSVGTTCVWCKISSWLLFFLSAFPILLLLPYPQKSQCFLIHFKAFI